MDGASSSHEICVGMEDRSALHDNMLLLSRLTSVEGDVLSLRDLTTSLHREHLCMQKQLLIMEQKILFLSTKEELNNDNAVVLGDCASGESIVTPDASLSTTKNACNVDILRRDSMVNILSKSASFVKIITASMAVSLFIISMTSTYQGSEYVLGAMKNTPHKPSNSVRALQINNGNDGTAIMPCSLNEPCGESQQFCNFGLGDTGSCEICPEIPSEMCAEINDRLFGAADCLSRCQDAQNYSEDVSLFLPPVSESEDSIECNTEEPCNPNNFCNYDRGDTGFCEPCSTISGQCLGNSNLSKKGAGDCNLQCEKSDSDDPPGGDVCDKYLTICQNKLILSHSSEDSLNYCAEAESACCKNDSCRCNFSEQLCIDFPDSKICDHVPSRCCPIDVNPLIEEYGVDLTNKDWRKHQNANCR